MRLVARISISLFFAVCLLSACGKIDTGIKGKMVLAKCTGTDIATDCVAQSIYASSLTIYDENITKIKTVKSNGDGTFLIALKPGTYFIHPENSGKFPMAADFKVVVTKGKLDELTIYYDTGLR
jgi:hypothetical protein